MHVSTDMILKQQQHIPTDHKVMQPVLKSVDLNPEETPSTIEIYQRSIQDVITQLMKAALTQTKSKLTILEFLQHNPLFKNLGNFSYDLKTLMRALKDDFHFEKSFLLLQNFQKNIRDVDAKTIQMYIKNSGLFFESTLAFQTDIKGFLARLEALALELREHFVMMHKTSLFKQEIEALWEYLVSLDEISLEEAQTILKSMLRLLREGTKEYLAFERPFMLKPSYTLVNKLEIILQTASSIKTEEPFTLSISLENDPEFKALLLDLRKEIIKQDLSNLIDEIIPSIDEVLNTSHTRVALQLKASLAQERLLEEQLGSIVSRIKQEVALYDKKMPLLNIFVEKSNILEQKILSMMKPEIFIAPEIMQKLSIHPSDAQILGDVKGVLVRISDKLLSSSHPNAKSTLELSNRLITHIEYYQLLSYVEGSNHIYLPFVWEDLKEGSMVIKQSKQDAFCCQIDLNLDYYGKFSVMLLLYQERYISLSITTQKHELKQRVQARLGELEEALTNEGMIVQTMKVSDYKEPLLEKNDYFTDETLQFGLNITI